MGGHPSGNRDGERERNTERPRISYKNIGSLKEIPDPEVYRETSNAISRFHSVLGVRERNIRLADITGAVGLQSNSRGILLDRETFSKSRAQIEEMETRNYRSGWSTETNKPIAHTVTHELGHALWNSNQRSENSQRAGKEIQALYRVWMRDPGAPGYGKYATTNVDEFWAETVTKAVHGKQDQYTAEVKRIVRDYKL